jgi:hypothetical protein
LSSGSTSTAEGFLVWWSDGGLHSWKVWDVCSPSWIELLEVSMTFIGGHVYLLLFLLLWQNSWENNLKEERFIVGRSSASIKFLGVQGSGTYWDICFQVRQNAIPYTSGYRGRAQGLQASWPSGVPMWHLRVLVWHVHCASHKSGSAEWGPVSEKSW